MHYTREWTQLSQNTKKFVHVWEPDNSGSNERRGVVCIVHGLGEHGGRYERLAYELGQDDFAVVAFDQTGHGRSQERRGCIASYESMLDDISAVLAWTERRYGQAATLLGHSMGGNLVLNYAIRRASPSRVTVSNVSSGTASNVSSGAASNVSSGAASNVSSGAASNVSSGAASDVSSGTASDVSSGAAIPAGVIASSPMIRSSREPGRLFEIVARGIAQVAPNLRLKSVVKPWRLMSDPTEQKIFEEDNLFHTYLSLRLGAALLDTGRWLLENADRLAVPTLLTHGTEDFLTLPDASAEFAKRAGDVCQLALLDGHLHDTFRDIGREQVIERFAEFARYRACQAST